MERTGDIGAGTQGGGKFGERGAGGIRECLTPDDISRHRYVLSAGACVSAQLVGGARGELVCMEDGCHHIAKKSRFLAATPNVRKASARRGITRAAIGEIKAHESLPPPVALHLGIRSHQGVCMSSVREGEEIMIEKETYGPKDALAGLAREIGYPERFHPDPAAVLASWTRLLAELAVLHTTPLVEVGESVIGCPHMDSLVAWSDTIQKAPADEMRATCDAIHKAILDLDNDDGWPTDRALSVLNNVCLGAKFGLKRTGRYAQGGPPRRLNRSGLTSFAGDTPTGMTWCRFQGRLGSATCSGRRWLW